MNFLEFIIKMILIVVIASIINPTKIFESCVLSLLGLIVLDLIELKNNRRN